MFYFLQVQEKNQVTREMNLKANFALLNSTTNARIGVLKLLLTLIRSFYIGGAICFVGFGYYTTILKAKAGYRNVEEEVNVLPKYRYPSLTFCYVFKDSGKHNSGKYVWTLFYRHLIQKWKQSGKSSYFVLENVLE